MRLIHLSFLLLFLFLSIIAKSQVICDTLAVCNQSLNSCSHDNCGTSAKRYLEPIFVNTDIQVFEHTYACISDSLDPCSDPLSKEMKVDFYYNPNDCVCCDRPVVLIGPAGGFQGAIKTKETVVAWAMEFAKLGYVAAVFKYRTGFRNCCVSLGQLHPDCAYQGDVSLYEDISYRALQDASSLVRYVKSNAFTLGIDPDKIMLGGVSAGGLLAAHLAYMDNSEIDSNLLIQYGPIERYGDQNVDDNVAGIFAMWGSLKDTSFLNQDENGDEESTPFIWFHGNCDHVYPYASYQYNCYENSDGSPYMYFGPEMIRQHIENKSLPICYEIHTGCGFTHGMHNPCGAGNKGYLVNVGNYVIDKSAHFFYNNSFACISGCESQSRFMCKPCYCNGCSIPGKNYPMAGCETCQDTAVHGNSAPSSLNLCDSVAQLLGMVDCSPFGIRDDLVRNLYEDSVSPTTVRLNWDSICGPSHYEIRGRKLGHSNWLKFELDPNEKIQTVFSGLANQTSYEWQIRAHYNDETINGWSLKDTFYTDCVKPDSHYVSSTSSHGAQLNWNHAAGNFGYRIKGKRIGSQNQATLNIPPSFDYKNVFGLATGTLYEWKVATICNQNKTILSSYTSLDTFITNSNAKGYVKQESKNNGVSIFPNPLSTENLTIVLNEEYKLAETVLIHDQYGKLIHRAELDGNFISITIPDGLVSSGLYFISLKSDQIIFADKLIINR